MKIVQNLWQVGGGDLTAQEDAAIYLVRFAQQAALIDAGCGNAHNRLVANISAVLPPGVQITYLFLTHCHYDHVGGAAALKEQCRVDLGIGGEICPKHPVDSLDKLRYHFYFFKSGLYKSNLKT
jgi:glyoxylase-like metal-dependent hydrolase (beta-lactamase superfamily II)